MLVRDILSSTCSATIIAKLNIIIFTLTRTTALNPETTSLGLGMFGNETGVYQNYTGFSCQTIDAAGAPSVPNRV